LLVGRFYHCCSSKEERKQRFEQLRQTYNKTLPRVASVVDPEKAGSDVRLRFVNPFAPETKHTTTSQYMQSISTSLLGNNHKLGGIGAPLGKLGGLKSR
jgi:hypothetical protein